MYNYDPISLSEVYWWADKAKTVTRQDAENIQRLLLSRVADVGMSSPEVKDVINGITDRFVEEEKRMLRELMADDLRRRGLLAQEKIYADDDQILQALKMTLPRFKSDWDWGGIYRILVDYCGFKDKITDFVRSMAHMGVYPKDNKPSDINHSIPPSIRGDEWCGHPFSYQAVQKGIKKEWPGRYWDWQICDIQDRDFVDRRSIAKIYKDNLLRASNR